MPSYYNENDPFNAQWLRNLIKAGMLPDGYVDERSIEDVTPADLWSFEQCHFFAGIGIWAYAASVAGWPEDRPLWTGSCPCQPFSAIGERRGVADERHLWPAWHFLIEECGPPVVFGEQVASNDGLAWLDVVSTDLEEAGYAVAPFDLPAAGFGAPHPRQRLYFAAELADGEQSRLERHARHVGRRYEPGWFPSLAPRSVAEGRHDGVAGATNGFWADADWLAGKDGFYRPVQPGSFPMAHGHPRRVEDLHASGNAIVAPQAIEFIKAFLDYDGSRKRPTLVKDLLS